MTPEFKIVQFKATIDPLETAGFGKEIALQLLWECCKFSP